MAYRFNCAECSHTVIVRYLKPGETAQCRHCGAQNIVPSDAAVASEHDVESFDAARVHVSDSKEAPKPVPSKRRVLFPVVAVAGAIAVAAIALPIATEARLKRSSGGMIMGSGYTITDPRDLVKFYQNVDLSSYSPQDRAHMLQGLASAEAAVASARSGAFTDACLAALIFMGAVGVVARVTRKPNSGSKPGGAAPSDSPKRAHAVEWYNRGCEQQQSGAVAEALSSYDKAVKLWPHDPDFWYNRAECLVKLDRRPDAVESLSRAAEFNPTDSDTLFELGELAQDTGLMDVALPAFQRFLAVADKSDPRRARARTNAKELAEQMPGLAQGPQSHTGFPE